MSADSTLPPAERRNYKGIGDAFVRTVKEDGVAGLFRGAGPTIARAMALNMGMFASNEQAREMLQVLTLFFFPRVSPVIRESISDACGLSVCCCQERIQSFTKLYRITMAQHGHSSSVRDAAWRGRVWERSRGMGVLFRAHQWHPLHPQLNVSTMRLRVYRATRACAACH